MASYPRRLCGPMAVIAAVAALVAAARPGTGGTSATDGTGGWRAAPAPAVPAGSASLTALAMAGPCAGWTAGFTLGKAPGSPFEPLLASWNGQRWRDIPVSVGTAAGGRIDGLAALSSRDAWAVGTEFGSTGLPRPLILRWDGHRWAHQAAAPVPGYPYAQLLAVAARSATDAWAVGQAQPAGRFAMRPVIEHWDGRRWALLPDPRVPALTGLDGVTVSAGGQAWAVGTPFRYHPNGFVLRWTGHRWVTAATPGTSTGVALAGVTAVRPDDVWAVGQSVTGGGPYRAYALHWDGRRWRQAAVPGGGSGAGDRGFSSVAAAGHGRLVAVGSYALPGTAGRGALYALWNGHRWSVRTGPRDTAELNVAAFDGGHLTWAAGSIGPRAFRPLMQVRG